MKIALQHDLKISMRGTCEGLRDKQAPSSPSHNDAAALQTVPCVRPTEQRKYSRNPSGSSGGLLLLVRLVIFYTLRMIANKSLLDRILAGISLSPSLCGPRAEKKCTIIRQQFVCQHYYIKEEGELYNGSKKLDITYNMKNYTGWRQEMVTNTLSVFTLSSQKDAINFYNSQLASEL